MIIIALGANLPSRSGSPSETIEAALQSLKAHGLKIIKMSRIWLTAPVPVSDQPWFHNAAVAIETNLDAFGLLSLLHKIETEFGRARFVRNEARILDLDLIAYNNEVIDRPSLIVPHPRMHERAFVLMPVQDLIKDWEHPILKKSLSELIDNLSPEQMARPA